MAAERQRRRARRQAKLHKDGRLEALLAHRQRAGSHAVGQAAEGLGAGGQRKRVNAARRQPNAAHRRAARRQQHPAAARRGEAAGRQARAVGRGQGELRPLHSAWGRSQAPGRDGQAGDRRRMGGLQAACRLGDQGSATRCHLSANASTNKCALIEASNFSTANAAPLATQGDAG